MQWLSFNLNRHNPAFTPSNWRAVYWDGRAFTNGNGFDAPGDPRADFVNDRDVNDPLPRLMKAIICGGMFIRGEVQGLNLYCTPGVSGIDVSKPMPTVDEVLERNWYFTAVTAGDVIHQFPQGGGLPVLIPYFLIVPVVYPLTWFERWESGALPDPLRIYR
jgi:hypothetical protein